MAQQFFYDRQIRRYIQQFIRLFSGFSVQMGKDETGLANMQLVPVRYGDINRMAAHITRENSENIVNTVPFISCYVTNLAMAPELRTLPSHVDKVQVIEKKYDDTTGEYSNEPGNRYTIERHNPVTYKLSMNCDIWTSNTEQKLQLMEQILVLFNPTLDIKTSSNPYDWSSLSYVEMVNTAWSSRSVGSSIDDIIDVASLTFDMPVLINPPAKVKQQKLIHTIINQMYNLDEADLDNFKENNAFDKSTVEYTVVTFEDRKIKYENNEVTLLALDGSNLDSSDQQITWAEDLKKFGVLRDGISQIRLRKSSTPGDDDNDIIGKLYEHPNDPQKLSVTIDQTTLPTNTLQPIDGVINGMVNYPGDGTVPTPTVAGIRYLLMDSIPVSSNWNGLSTANKYDIVEFNGTSWSIVFNASANQSATHHCINLTTQDQLEWNGKNWVNSYEAVYNAGFWRIYL
tara:strand:+ start:580 stop:1947 length:1368 start_codon:yes stop_codon:yes gene_type:complete